VDLGPGGGSTNKNTKPKMAKFQRGEYADWPESQIDGDAEFDYFDEDEFKAEVEDSLTFETCNQKYGSRQAKPEMSLADWRWAAKKGFWNSEARCWNEDMGGKMAYIEQRDQRRLQKSTKAPSAVQGIQECSHLEQVNPLSKLHMHQNDYNLNPILSFRRRGFPAACWNQFPCQQ
jgi:hypothetical protein